MDLERKGIVLSTLSTFVSSENKVTDQLQSYRIPLSLSSPLIRHQILECLIFATYQRLCQADLTWKLIPLNYCPGKEGKACVVLVCSQLEILMFSLSSYTLQIPIDIDGNKVVTYLV